MSRAKWTPAHDRALFMGIGAFGLKWLQNQTEGRSTAALYARARRVCGPGGLTRGTYTLNQLVQQTGYSQGHLTRAMKALNQKWKRMSARGAYLVSEDQLEEILEWLKHDYWCKNLHLYGCAWCATTTKDPFGLGLCKKCYFRHRRLCIRIGVPHTLKGQRAALQKIRPLVKSDPEGTFLDNARARVKRGLALTLEQLDWLAMLHP